VNDEMITGRVPTAAGVAAFVTNSGTREEFPTGALRDTEVGKGAFDCIPYAPLKRLADLYQRGAVKYGKHNWQLGIDEGRCYSSMIRHAMQALAVFQGHAGEEMQREDHLAAVVFNAFCLMFYQETGLAPSTR